MKTTKKNRKKEKSKGDEEEGKNYKGYLIPKNNK